ncbi:unnamed protein product [Orchesella dallaii]|uniref:Uncharacterized protein n=1 Tax=Orchesella dallaii TaxID=48710 RepID=A0ABP1RYQ8_9HEXA
MSYPTQPDFPEVFQPQPQPSFPQNQYQPGVYQPAFPSSTVPYNNQYMGPPPLQFAGGVGQVGGITTNQRRCAMTGMCVGITLFVICFFLPVIIFAVVFFTVILPNEKKAGRL